MSTTAPLAGVRVLEVASFVAAPAAATLLSDLGATVVKVEPPAGGDPWRKQSGRPGLPQSDADYLWNLTGRNKKSIALDLKSAAAQAVLHRMAQAADVFVTNTPIGLRRKLGIGYEAVAARNPRLVYASLTGYGEVDDVDAGEKAYDTTAWWGPTGLMEQLRASPQAEPVRPPVAMGDHTSALSFFGAIMAALYHQQRTGLGCYVGTSLIATGAWVNGGLLQAGLCGAEFPARPLRSATANPLQCHYLCADGRWVMLIVGFEPAEGAFARLAACLALDGLATDPRFATYEARERNCRELVALLDRKFAQRPAAAWLDPIRAAGFTIEILNSPADAAADPRLRRAGVVVPLPGVERVRETIACPIWFRDIPRSEPRRAPRLNEHAEEVLAQCGFSAREVDGLITSGVVAASGPESA